MSDDVDKAAWEADRALHAAAAKFEAAETARLKAWSGHPEYMRELLRTARGCRGNGTNPVGRLTDNISQSVAFDLLSRLDRDGGISATKETDT
jgi:hypothetical protein